MHLGRSNDGDQPGKYGLAEKQPPKKKNDVLRPRGPRVDRPTRVLNVAKWGYGIGEAIGIRRCGGTRNGVEMRTKEPLRRGRIATRAAETQTTAVLGWRAIGGARTVGGARSLLGGELGEPSESARGWVWGMGKPGAQKGSRMAGGTKKRAEGAVLSLEGRMKEQRGVGVI
ncbi:hypothetical protein C8J57DRAFT_1224767 [Mycena rebaudengoi]|nr:hypothetical protein C8J57DRAFT_1224767 [Mycena rebaudengoi]